MAGGIITANVAPRLLLPQALTEIYGLEYEMMAEKAIYKKLYESKKSDRYYEEFLQLVGVGPASKKDEGGIIELDDYQQGYARISTHTEWGKRMRITNVAMEDNKHLDQAKILAGQLARSSMLAREINGHALFNSPTSTTGTFAGNSLLKGSDGVSLLSTAHPLVRGGTLNNKPTVDADISEAALEAAMQDIWSWTDDAGNRMMAQPKALLFHQSSTFDVHRILESNLRPFTADNDANALKDLGVMGEKIPSVYLNNTKAWFILTDQPGLVFAERRGAEQFTYNDDQTRDLVFGISERYLFDFSDWRSVYGSVGV